MNHADDDADEQYTSNLWLGCRPSRKKNATRKLSEILIPKPNAHRQRGREHSHKCNAMQCIIYSKAVLRVEQGHLIDSALWLSNSKVLLRAVPSTKGERKGKKDGPTRLSKVDQVVSNSCYTRVLSLSSISFSILSPRAVVSSS